MRWSLNLGQGFLFELVEGGAGELLARPVEDEVAAEEADEGAEEENGDRAEAAAE